MENQIDYKIFPLGESAIVVEFGKSISLEINEKIRVLAKTIEEFPFPGFTECVPAYASLTIFYNLFLTQKSNNPVNTAFSFVKSFVEGKILNLPALAIKDSQEIEIPVNFDKDSALDLDFVAKTNKISTEEVIEIFLGKTYSVFMIGFLPGFAYMGEIDDSIATSRKNTPRTSVPKGSVGIAGNQTGIYSIESPGGWQIIGRTDRELFTPFGDSLTLLNAGDKVKFIRK